ncbi:excalibur calcium-binding domain-containing protein [Glaesserella parasuis]|nr:excalibur calcium-binding domain-containing protein [Glaesserella parasuis]MCT8746260.1 excalibur calcium-binding domain-containing protein [Glaesserella parasuis]MCT8748765.1 excalibur calcium-binding domain-containing protein [Glaesserella parasuis]MCT8772300.1 excalibur calcium-binding domain-containing protein [Glaesserella parasuis]MCT8777390.1 excalibur calcium-binding domain-containing protein [Glaesserella parasuis]
MKKFKVFLFVCSAFFTFPSLAQEYDCDKRYCKEMVNCDEAYYHLKICGLVRLDRDGDGVPCENVCGKSGKKQSKKSKQTIQNLLNDSENEESNESDKDQKN